MKNRKLVLAALVGGLSVVVGCETIQETIGGSSEVKQDCVATVWVYDPIQGEDKNVEVAIKSCKGNDNLFAGIKHLQNEDYELAAESFEAAVAENEENADAHFGLAVTHEALENYDAAIEHYKRSNFLKTSPAANEGRIRSEASLNG